MSINMDRSALNRSASIKYLGVIDQKLNWCEHIAYVKNKVSKGVGILHRARQFLDKKAYIIYIIPMYISIFNLLY